MVYPQPQVFRTSSNMPVNLSDIQIQVVTLHWSRLVIPRCWFHVRHPPCPNLTGTRHGNFTESSAVILDGCDVSPWNRVMNGSSQALGTGSLRLVNLPTHHTSGSKPRMLHFSSFFLAQYGTFVRFSFKTSLIFSLGETKRVCYTQIYNLQNILGILPTLYNHYFYVI